MPVTKLFSVSQSSSKLPPDIRLCGGLKPQFVFCITGEYSREDVKEVLFHTGCVLTRTSLTSTLDLSLAILNQSNTALLSGLARQELYRSLLDTANPRTHILKNAPLFLTLKRQMGFYQHLDTSLQKGRSFYAHHWEADVLFERLAEVLGECPLRTSLRWLSDQIDEWMLTHHFFDPPLLLKLASDQLLEAPEEDLRQKLPQMIWRLGEKPLSPVEELFWSRLSRISEIIEEPWPLAHLSVQVPETPSVVRWNIYHTKDDAAEVLAERLSQLPKEEWSQVAIVCPDEPSLRASLRRAFLKYQLRFLDPRDPTSVKQSEALKIALLPLRLVAESFPRDLVVAYLRTHPSLTSFIPRIYELGLTKGLASYKAVSSECYEHLLSIQQRLAGRRRFEEFLPDIWALVGAGMMASLSNSAMEFALECLQKSCTDFLTDLSSMKEGSKRGAWAYWFYRVSARFSQEAPPIHRVRPAYGVRQYRILQASPFHFKAVYLLGLDAQFLSPKRSDDLWFTVQAQEILSKDFSINTLYEERALRLQALDHWHTSADYFEILDARYSSSGHKQVSLEGVLHEWQTVAKTPFTLHKEEKGSATAFEPSYFSLVQAPQAPSLHAEIQSPHTLQMLSASALDRASRCSFQYLVFDRWRCRDLVKPSFTLNPEARGKILHEAVSFLIKEWDTKWVKKVDELACLADKKHIDQELMILTTQVFQNAHHLVRSPQIFHLETLRIYSILKTFLLRERTYRSYAPISSLYLDNISLKTRIEGVTVVGRPDRIDECQLNDAQTSWFLMEYKASSKLPNASDIRMFGYRLQIPLYARMIRDMFQVSLSGCQVVALDERGARGAGILFAKTNKSTRSHAEDPVLTEVRRNSKSLVDVLPAEEEAFWKDCDTWIEKTIKRLQCEDFQAMPNQAVGFTECQNCQAKPVCGRHRHGIS